jgi:hypothetical protein
LIFDVHSGGAEFDERSDGARDVEGARTESGIDVDESGSAHTSVMRRMSVSTSSSPMMPRSGTPREPDATPAPDR